MMVEFKGVTSGVNGVVKTFHWGEAKVGHLCARPWSVWSPYSKHVPGCIGWQSNSFGVTVCLISCVKDFD